VKWAFATSWLLLLLHGSCKQLLDPCISCQHPVNAQMHCKCSQWLPGHHVQHTRHTTLPVKAHGADRASGDYNADGLLLLLLGVLLLIPVAATVKLLKVDSGQLVQLQVIAACCQREPQQQHCALQDVWVLHADACKHCRRQGQRKQQGQPPHMSRLKQQQLALKTASKLNSKQANCDASELLHSKHTSNAHRCDLLQLGCQGPDLCQVTGAGRASALHSRLVA
jgi:hypothetical protein